MRVLHLGSPMGLYGAERWILALLKHLPRAQVDSTVGVIKDAPGPVPPLCEEAARMGFKTAIFEAHGKLSLPAIGQLRRHIRDNRIQILHTHGYKNDLIGLLAARGTGCRLLSTPHGWSVDAGLKLQVYETLDRLAFTFFDAVAPLSMELHAGLQRIPRMTSRLHFIPNGVDLDEVDAASGDVEDLSEWRSRGYQIIGYVGQLIRRKSVDTLIRAFARIDPKRKLLCIVGDGSERQALEDLAQQLGVGEHVRFFGYRPDRIRLMKSMDAFVLPSTLEGIPRCLLEAMAAGVAAVATNIPGCQELISDGDTGMLFDVFDDACLASKLRRLLDDDDARAAIARRGQERVRTRYSAAAMAHSYVLLYERLSLQRASASDGNGPRNQTDRSNVSGQ
jgi:glycosyltransferase involved in cell wall biosynthesis